MTSCEPRKFCRACYTFREREEFLSDLPYAACSKCRAAQRAERKKRLPAGPLQSVLRNAAATNVERGLLIGVDESRIRRFFAQSEVQLETADRWLVALGKNLSQVYPI